MSLYLRAGVLTVLVAGCKPPSSAMTDAPIKIGFSAETSGTVGTQVSALESSDAPRTLQSNTNQAIASEPHLVSGVEADKAGGCIYKTSQGSAHASYTPLQTFDKGVYGFALTATAYARGGHWQDSFIVCQEDIPSVAEASATATGVLDMSYRANYPSGLPADLNGDPLDYFIVTADARTDISVTQTEFGSDVSRAVNPLPSSDAQTQVYPILTPGTYQIRASITAKASEEGPTEETVRRTARVTLSTWNDPKLPIVTPDGTLPVELLVPLDSLQELLVSALFSEEGGRFYPCRGTGLDGPVDCGAQGQDIYLENPQLTTQGVRLNLDVQMSGQGKVGPFKAGVPATISLGGVPTIEDNAVRILAPQVEINSQHLLVRSLRKKLVPKLEEVIREQAAADLGPALQNLLDKLELPDTIAAAGFTACLLTRVDDAFVRSVETRDEPEGLLLRFGLRISARETQECFIEEQGPGLIDP